MTVDKVKDYAAKHYVYLHNVLLGLVRHAVLPRYWGAVVVGRLDSRADGGGLGLLSRLG